MKITGIQENMTVFIDSINLAALIAPVFVWISKSGNKQHTGKTYPSHSNEANVVILSIPQAKTVKINIASAQQEQGEVNYPALLQTEEAHQQATIDQIKAQAARFYATTALFQVLGLGGGWWKQTEDSYDNDATSAPT